MQSDAEIKELERLDDICTLLSYAITDTLLEDGTDTFHQIIVGESMKHPDGKIECSFNLDPSIVPDILHAAFLRVEGDEFDVLTSEESPNENMSLNLIMLIREKDK